MNYSKIEPTQFFPLTYQLDDGLTAPTRYIQAKIIKSSDRSIVATVNLTDNGSGSFSDFSKTPSSLSLSKGIYIEIITTVYKDSGYTDADDLRYALKHETYYVAEEMGGAILGGRNVGTPNININLDDIVEKIFSYKYAKEKKSFAYLLSLLNKFLEENKIKEIYSDTQEIKNSLNGVADILGKFSESLAIFAKNIGEEITLVKSKIQDNTMMGENIDLKMGEHINSLKEEALKIKVLSSEIAKENKDTLLDINSYERIKEKLNETLVLLKKLEEYYQHYNKPTMYGKLERLVDLIDTFLKNADKDKAKRMVDKELDMMNMLGEIDKELVNFKQTG